MKTKVSILGSTGKIGVQALKIVQQFPEKFELIGISGFSNIALLKEQITAYHPKYVALPNEASAQKLQKEFANVTIISGKNCLKDLVSIEESNLICVAIVGLAALEPTIKAIECKKHIAIASKEVLVAAGQIIMKKIKEHKVRLYPIDSEHAAIDLCLKGYENADVKNLILTASGGPFWKVPAKKLASVTIKDALNHPNWDMGKKITIDSATLINKGLEVMEAHWLFGLDYSQIKILIHPKSIVHGLIELKNGAIIAQLSKPSMEMPILYALSAGKIEQFNEHRLDLTKQALKFYSPNLKKFKGLEIAYEVGKKGDSWPTVFNSANEEVVSLFLQEKIDFCDIVTNIEKVLQKHSPTSNPTLEEILEIDRWTRNEVRKITS